MTDMVNVEIQSSVGDKFSAQVEPSFEIDETYWGYIVKAAGGPSVGIVVAQSASMCVGAALVAASMGLWILPSSFFGADATILRMGATIIFLGCAALLLWFASRGTQSELQIDTSLGEIREVVRNRAGKSTLLGRYGFDAIGGVFLDRTKGNKNAALLLRYRNTAQTLLVAIGAEADLTHLRDRLGRDMLIGGDKPTAA